MAPRSAQYHVALRGAIPVGPLSSNVRHHNQDMPARLDHLVVVAPSLAAGAQFVEQSLGVMPGPGRKHPHMGSHNLLLSLGASVYLEVAAADPEAGPLSRPRWFGLDDLAPTSPPRLAAWVASTDDILSATSLELGHAETMQRDGRTWQMTVTPDGRPPMSGAAPVIIQRSGNVHPAAALADSSLRLRQLRIEHPDPENVRALLLRIGLAQGEVRVVHGARCRLVAEVETPLGLRTLSDA